MRVAGLAEEVNRHRASGLAEVHSVSLTAEHANCVCSAAGTLLLTGTLIILYDLKISLS